VITFYTFPGTTHVESFSPFCMKVEVYLKLQQLEYERVLGDPRKAPKGKMPFIVDGDTKVADSAAILTYLEAKVKSPLDAGLDAEARARAHVIRRTLEESLYFAALWSNWIDDEGWAMWGGKIAAMMPAAVRWFLPGLIRGKVRSSLVGQGVGRHSKEEIYAHGRHDVEAVATLLGDRPYFLDDRLRTVDVVAYAFFANLLYREVPSPLTEAVSSRPALVSFVERVAARVKDAQKQKTSAAA
jgi:glutathione S-transferase